MLTRSKLNSTASEPLAGMPDETVIDGEIVALDAEERPARP
jgi:ATP-dependent DNA ligase